MRRARDGRDGWWSDPDVAAGVNPGTPYAPARPGITETEGAGSPWPPTRRVVLAGASIYPTLGQCRDERMLHKAPPSKRPKRFPARAAALKAEGPRAKAQADFGTTAAPGRGIAARDTAIKNQGGDAAVKAGGPQAEAQADFGKTATPVQDVGAPDLDTKEPVATRMPRVATLPSKLEVSLPGKGPIPTGQRRRDRIWKSLIRSPSAPSCAPPMVGGRIWWEAACPLRSGVVKMRTFALRGSLAGSGQSALERKLRLTNAQAGCSRDGCRQ